MDEMPETLRGSAVKAFKEVVQMYNQAQERMHNPNGVVLFGMDEIKNLAEQGQAVINDLKPFHAVVLPA